jgi:hypothetical protein
LNFKVKDWKGVTNSALGARTINGNNIFGK